MRYITTCEVAANATITEEVHVGADEEGVDIAIASKAPHHLPAEGLHHGEVVVGPTVTEELHVGADESGVGVGLASKAHHHMPAGGLHHSEVVARDRRRGTWPGTP